MTHADAQQLVQRIRQDMQAGNQAYKRAYASLLQLRQSDDGIAALGYDSFAELYEAEFSDLMSRSRFYRTGQYVETIADLAEVDSTIDPTNPDTLPPERATRPLNSLPDKTARQQAWRAAQRDGDSGAPPPVATPSPTGNRPTSTETQHARNRWLVENHPLADGAYLYITEAMRSGALSAGDAAALQVALDSCSAGVRRDLTQHRVWDTTIVWMLNERRGSNTYNEIVATGGLYVGDDQEVLVPLSRLTPQQLRDELSRRSRIYAQSGASGHRPVSVLSYPSRPDVTVKELLSTHSRDQLEALHRVIGEALASLPDDNAKAQ